MNLKNELEQLKSQDTAKHNDAVSEVKLLLAGDAQDDINIIRNLAGLSSIARAEDALGRKITLENLEKDYGNVYKIDTIKSLCIKYRLRFLNSSFFKGTLPVETVAKIKQFAKDTNTQIDPHTLKTRFFIIAPVELFSLNKISERAERERLKRELDPVLFYKIDDEHYRMIHKWGNDFSPFRRLVGIFWESKANHNGIAGAFFILSAITIISLIIATWHLSGSAIDFIVRFVSCIITFALCLVMCSRYANYQRDEHWSENNWNTTDLWTK